MVVGVFNSIGNWFGFGNSNAASAFLFKKIDGSFEQMCDEECRIEFSGEVGERLMVVQNASETVCEEFCVQKMKRFESFADNTDGGACFGFGIKRDRKFIVHFGFKFKNESIREAFETLLEDNRAKEAEAEDIVEDDDHEMEEEPIAQVETEVEKEAPVKRSPINSAKKMSRTKAKAKKSVTKKVASRKRKAKAKKKDDKKKAKKAGKKKGTVARAKRDAKKNRR